MKIILKPRVLPAFLYRSNPSVLQWLLSSANLLKYPHTQQLLNCFFIQKDQKIVGTDSCPTLNSTLFFFTVVTALDWETTPCVPTDTHVVRSLYTPPELPATALCHIQLHWGKQSSMYVKEKHSWAHYDITEHLSHWQPPRLQQASWKTRAVFLLVVKDGLERNKLLPIAHCNNILQIDKLNTRKGNILFCHFESGKKQTEQLEECERLNAVENRRKDWWRRLITLQNEPKMNSVFSLLLLWFPFTLPHQGRSVQKVSLWAN